MSFILDALRKVDEESRRADEPLPPVVAIERMRVEKRSRRRHLVLMAAIAAISAMATAWLLRPTPSMPPEVSSANSASLPPAVPVDPGEPPPPSPESTIAEIASPSPPPAEAVSEPAPTVAVVEVPPAESPAQKDEVEPEPEPEPSDPVLEAEEPAPALEIPQLVLQGTSVLAGRPVAVVSDRRVFEGDIIEGAVVIRISERLVELDFNGRRFTLTF
jgi:hypothetical protein